MKKHDFERFNIVKITYDLKSKSIYDKSKSDFKRDIDRR